MTALHPEFIQQAHSYALRCATFKGLLNNAEDIAQDAVLVLIDQASRRNIEHLYGYSRGVINYTICHHIEDAIARRNEFDIDEVQWNGNPILALKERLADEKAGPAVMDRNIDAKRLTAILRTVVLAPIDRTIILRFYVDGAPWQQIASEMKLTSTQFRLRKSRALKKIRAAWRIAA